jgi:transposase
MDDELFADVDRQGEAEAAVDGAVRLETANRTQVELTPTDLETLLAPGHAARLVWRFVEGLDLQQFHATIRAREGRAGRPAIDPKILVALWLYATIDGVGSAREVDRLCYAHDAYRWLRGGVSVNYHTLSTFRVAHQAALDDLLTQSITVLLDKQVVTLNRIAQDGTKIRASASVRSFKRGERLRSCRQMARQQVARTKAEADGVAPARRAAAQRRAAAEQVARVEEALAQLPEVEATKVRNQSRGAAKVSTTDPDARVMKLADGGFRPAYNVQFATDVDSHAVVGVAVTNEGADGRQLPPMLAQVERRTRQWPGALLADGGYVSLEAVTAAAACGTWLYMPVPKGPQALGAGVSGARDPAVAAWRARMATPLAPQVYRARAATAERLNADVRTHRGLGPLLVRGLRKVHMVALWVGLAQNVMRAMAIVPHLMT